MKQEWGYTANPGQCYCGEHLSQSYDVPSWWLMEWDDVCIWGEGHTPGHPLAGPFEHSLEAGAWLSKTS